MQSSSNVCASTALPPPSDAAAAAMPVSQCVERGQLATGLPENVQDVTGLHSLLVFDFGAWTSLCSQGVRLCARRSRGLPGLRSGI